MEPMLDAIKPLLESGIINEGTQQAIKEAWESQISEAKEQVRSELREEFAQRYQHDKQVMVEALDKMVTESLTAEISEFQTETQKLAEDRAKFNSRMVEATHKFDSFLVTKLAEEIQELRADRKQYENSVAKLEQFVIKALAEEIQEFEADKRAVVETKVQLVAGAKAKLAELQSAFVERSAQMVKESVAAKLESEMTQLKEDIQIARENMFGRRLFEAFAGEFAVTHLNENKEIANLRKIIETQNEVVAESRKIAQEKAVLVESKEKELRIIKESTDRKVKLADMLKPLNKEKATVMSELLESVQTDKLQSAFDKYLPAVLNGGASAKTTQKVALTESKVEVTGDKTAKQVQVQEVAETANVFELKRLAGLK
jgi:hypothetical protein